jgi:hypothetical protein
MSNSSPLNLFYQEPDFDRWLPFDRYPRRFVRRLVRGPRRQGGQERVFLNLCAGLDRLGIEYRTNDFRHARRNPGELACIIGKPFVLDLMKWKNPILFGASGYSHPIDDPELLHRLPVKKILVPGEWMRQMCQPYWGDKVAVWPVGINAGRWTPSDAEKDIDVLLYDKVMWKHDELEATLIEPIRAELRAGKLSLQEIRYGSYQEEDYREALKRSRAMIFLCEHETQGIAYQQALSSGVPIFTWDRGGPWRDPVYYPHKVIFEPVTSVPYWDERCGMKFADLAEFRTRWEGFWDWVQGRRFSPRDYILENLTLEKCARRYVEIAESLAASV